MGTTQIIAVMDRNTIAGQYIRNLDVSDDKDLVDVTIKLIHQFTTPANATEELELQTFVVPASYLTQSGLTAVTPVQQIADFHIANPRYIEDLFIEISETRDTAPIVTRVPVLNGDDATVPVLPDNPFKDPEHEENIREEIPERNISTPEEDINPILYNLDSDDLALVQASKRIFLEGNVFFSQDFNEKLDVIYIENSITNFLPNADFELTGTVGSLEIPQEYTVAAPGMVVSSQVIDGQIENTSIWRTRTTNNNPFNAFDTVTFGLSEKVALFSGINSLTISLFYTVVSDFGVTPFSDFKVRANFYNTIGDLISTEETLVPVGAEGDKWKLLFGTFQGSQIPLAATQFDFEIEIAAIGSTDPFTLQFYLPQAESSPFPTTRTLDNRIHDKYLTTRAIDLKLPLYFVATALHVIGPGIRGLVSSTTDQKDGIQFLASSDTLRVKAFDVTGNLLFNIASDTFSVTEGDVTEYGLFLDGSTIEFFLNGSSLSTISQSHTLDQTKEICVGSLEASNTTINSVIRGFKILRTTP